MIQDRAELTRCQDSVPSVCLQSSSPQFPISEKEKIYAAGGEQKLVWTYLLTLLSLTDAGWL